MKKIIVSGTAGFVRDCLIYRLFPDELPFFVRDYLFEDNLNARKGGAEA